jgi:hypothetical protein
MLLPEKPSDQKRRKALNPRCFRCYDLIQIVRINDILLIESSSADGGQLGIDGLCPSSIHKHAVEQESADADRPAGVAVFKSRPHTGISARPLSVYPDCGP